MQAGYLKTILLSFYRCKINSHNGVGEVSIVLVLIQLMKHSYATIPLDENGKNHDLKVIKGQRNGKHQRTVVENVHHRNDKDSTTGK